MENIDLNKIIAFTQEKAIIYLPKIVIAGLILWIGFKVLDKLLIFIDSILKKIFDDTIRPFFNSTVSFIAHAILVVVAAGIVGFDLAGFISIFAAAAFAIGMALQGSLGNFASGILILTLKPYRVNEWIQVEEKFGRVDLIGVFNTIIITPGNKTLIVPNSKITDNIITNYSKKGYIRLEINVTMPYSESFPKVKKIIEDALVNVENIIDEPKTEIGIENFDSHSIQLIIRPYVQPQNFWQVTFDSHEAVKKAFNKHNIKVAYSEGVEMGSIGE